MIILLCWKKFIPKVKSHKLSKITKVFMGLSSTFLFLQYAKTGNRVLKKLSWIHLFNKLWIRIHLHPDDESRFPFLYYLYAMICLLSMWEGHYWFHLPKFINSGKLPKCVTYSTTQIMVFNEFCSIVSIHHREMRLITEWDGESTIKNCYFQGQEIQDIM